MIKKEKAEFNEYVKLINEEVEDVKDTSTGSAVMSVIAIFFTFLTGIVFINHLRAEAREERNHSSLVDGTRIDTDLTDVVFVLLDETIIDEYTIDDSYCEFEFEGVNYVEFNDDTLLLNFNVGDEGDMVFNMDHVVAWGIDK